MFALDVPRAPAIDHDPPPKPGHDTLARVGARF
jgi:hypothetical protein